MTLGATYGDNLLWIIIPHMVEALLNKYRVYFRIIDPTLNVEVIFWGKNGSSGGSCKGLGGVGYGVIGGGYLFLECDII